MKLKIWPAMICAIALLTGCLKATEPVVVDPLFCDLYEPRRFDQAELDWRVKHAPWNIRKDLANNEDWRGECGGSG